MPNALALAVDLSLQTESTRRFLLAALESDQPGATSIANAGVPHYEALRFCRRLEAAGEITAAGWVAEARAGYQALLAASEAPSARRLERMSREDRPREKAIKSGINSLSDAELLALLLRTGHGDEGVLEMADRLLLDHDGLVGLARCDLDGLCLARGIGPAKASEIAAAFELGSRLAQAERRRDRPRLTNPEEIAAFVARELVRLDHEQFWCLAVDARACLIGEPRLISKGDVDGTDAAPREFFRHALLANASSCIAVHNHPTGDPQPSPADRAVTVRLVLVGRNLGLPCHDHLIIGDGGRFVSLRRDHPECWR